MSAESQRIAAGQHDIYNEVLAIEKEIKVLADADLATKAVRGVELNASLRHLTQEVPKGAVAAGLLTYIAVVRQELYRRVLDLDLTPKVPPYPTIKSYIDAHDARNFRLDDGTSQLGYEASHQKARADHPKPPILADYPAAKKARVTRDEMAGQWDEDRKALLSHLAANERIIRDLSLQVTKEREQRVAEVDRLNMGRQEHLREVRQQHEEQLGRVMDERDLLRAGVRNLTNDLHRARVQVEAFTTALALEIPVDGTESD